MSHQFYSRNAGDCYFCANPESDPIHQVAARQWLPSDWLDESVPELGNSPDDFLRRSATGGLFLHPINPDEDDTWPGVEPLVVGQVVEFSWFETYSGIEVTFPGDGTFSIDGEIAESANCFRVDEDIYGSVAEFVEAVRRGEHEVALGRPIEVDLYCWSDAVRFRLSVGEGGFAHFEQVAE